MKTNGQLFNRALLVMVLLLMFAVQPLRTPVTAAAEAFQSDDFNRCSLNTSLWTFENPGSASTAAISGQYQGDSTFNFTVPGGSDLTFSNKNKNAPRIMQAAADADFEAEVKFNSSLGQPPAGAWNIQGILVRDSTSVPNKTKWLRFDLNRDFDSINYYVGYIDENGLLTHVITVKTITSNPTKINASPLYLRVKYQKTLQQWTLGYRLGDSDTLHWATPFTNTTVIPGGITFDVNSIGVFAGSTSDTAGVNPTGIVSKVDYIRTMTNTTFVDDVNTLTVQKVGVGAVNWPMTSPSQCSGNSVTLTASPANGSTFTDWKENSSVIGTSPTITLEMTLPHTVTATFGGQPLDLPFKSYIPMIRR